MTIYSECAVLFSVVHWLWINAVVCLYSFRTNNAVGAPNNSVCSLLQKKYSYFCLAYEILEFHQVFVWTLCFHCSTIDSIYLKTQVPNDVGEARKIRRPPNKVCTNCILLSAGVYFLLLSGGCGVDLFIFFVFCLVGWLLFALLYFFFDWIVPFGLTAASFHFPQRRE